MSLLWCPHHVHCAHISHSLSLHKSTPYIYTSSLLYERTVQVESGFPVLLVVLYFFDCVISNLLCLSKTPNKTLANVLSCPVMIPDYVLCPCWEHHNGVSLEVKPAPRLADWSRTRQLSGSSSETHSDSPSSELQQPHLCLKSEEQRSRSKYDFRLLSCRLSRLSHLLVI